MLTSWSGTQNLSGQRTGMRSSLIKHLTINNRVLNSFGPHHEATAAAGQIVDRFAGLAGNLIVVKNHNVSGKPGCQPSSVLQPKKVGRLRGGTFDRLLQ